MSGPSSIILIEVTQTDMPTDNADSWKKKYFTSLEGLESKERVLSEIEGVLRLALNRLTLAAEGVDKGLDRQLAELRKSARGTFDKQRLERLIEAISETVKRLDAKHARKTRPESHLSDLLVAMLDAVDFPKEMEKRAREIRRQLAEAPASEQPAQLITIVVHLINESLARSGNKTVSNNSKSVAGQHESEVKPAPPETANNILIEKDAGLSLGKDLLTVLLRGIRQRDAGDEALTRIQRGLQEAKEEQELRAIALTMTTLLAAADAISHEASRQEPVTLTSAAPPLTAAEILIQLLDTIALPAELVERADNIKERLSTGIGQGLWPEVLGDITELIASMRTRIEAEKSELESFLLQLTERLQELDQHLQGAETLRTHTHTRSRALDAAVHAQMDGIETSVRGASSLLELKTSIQTRLEHIKAHFEEHRQTEEEQQAALQSQLKIATSRLTVLESETGRLKTHLQAQQLQATMDALTNLPNRLAYDARLEREYARWKRHKTPLTLLVLDVDRFKQINDTYGHKAGDKALKLIAFVLKQTVRETDFIARYGGEEFVAIISDTPSVAALNVAEKMRASVEAADFHHNKQKVAITISVGVSSFRDSDTAEMVFVRADKALYRAKSLGRNRCVDDTSLPASNEGM